MVTNANDQNSLFRQLGEIGATQTAFREDIQDLKQAISSLTQERRTESDVMRGQQNILASRIDSLERQGTSQHQANTQRLDEITRDIGVMKGPVAQLIGFRKRIARLIVILFSVIAVVWTLAEPLYTFFVEKILSHL